MLYPQETALQQKEMRSPMENALSRKDDALAAERKRVRAFAGGHCAVLRALLDAKVAGAV